MQTHQLIKNRYRILPPPLGEGGFGITYLVQDTDSPGKLQRVLKQLKLFEQQTPDAIATAKRLFKQEADILKKLGQHDRIPELFDYFEENQEFYLVQELIKGQSLHDELIGVKLQENEVIQLLIEILDVLTFVHDDNVTHRDIKPENMMRRCSDGKIVLIDFGAAKNIQTKILNSPGQPPKTIAIGTPGYMPIEQLNGQPGLYSDVYAVGMVAIQALTGKQPSDLPYDQNTKKVIWKQYASQVNNELASILDKMIYPEHEKRYQSAQDALTALQSLPSVRATSPHSRTAVVAPVAKFASVIQTTLSRSPFPVKLCLGLGSLLIVAALTFFVAVPNFTQGSQAPEPFFFREENPVFGE